jgi:hypothetical protein
MKTIITLGLLLTFITFSSCDTLTQVAQAAAQTTTTPSQLEMVSGLKQALEQGTNKSTSQLSAVDGFFANAAIKILFPPEAQKAEKTLRSLGMGKLCDDVILSVNRAAEDAATQAKPIFVNAIKQMSFQDVANIVTGPKNAATLYFQRTTTTPLTGSFSPVIQNSLNKVGATKYYGDVATTYNKLPFVTHINPDLTNYVTQKAIEGLFFEIAKEELNIRQNLSARTTPLLQKVFAYADKNTKG